MRVLGIIDEQGWELSIASQGGWFLFTWVTLVTYIVLFLVGYAFAVKVATAANWPRAAAVGLTGFIVFQGFEYVFIR